MKQELGHQTDARNSATTSAAMANTDGVLTGMAANMAAVEAINAVLKESVHMSATVPSLPVKSARGLLSAIQSNAKANRTGSEDAHAGPGSQEGGHPAIDIHRCSCILTRDYRDEVPAPVPSVSGSRTRMATSRADPLASSATSNAWAASVSTRRLGSRRSVHHGRNDPISPSTCDQTHTHAPTTAASGKGKKGGGEGSNAHGSRAHMPETLDFDTRLDFVKTNRVVAVLEKAMERLQMLGLLHTRNPAAAGAHDGDSHDHRADSDEDEGNFNTLRHGSATVAVLPSMLLPSSRNSAYPNNEHNTTTMNTNTLTQAEQDKILATMSGVRQRGVTRMAASLGPWSTAAAPAATTAAIAQVMTDKEDYAYSRSRCTVAQLLAEQRQLEARYAELVHEAKTAAAASAASSSVPHTRSSRHDVAEEPRLDDGCFAHTQHTAESRRQQELASVARQLREHNRMLCTQLKDHPRDADNWNKIVAERQELLALLQRAVSELTSGYAAAVRQTRLGSDGGNNEEMGSSRYGSDTRAGRGLPPSTAGHGTSLPNAPSNSQVQSTRARSRADAPSSPRRPVSHCCPV